MMKRQETETHPVQTKKSSQGRLNKRVTMRAYEVYCANCNPQEAMVTGGCRGGFSAGEIIAMLYARSFPKEEWRAREREAYEGMEGL